MRVCVATAGHLSTCPRMVKVADALQGAGHDVHVVSTRSTEWATAADQHLMQARAWSWEAIDLGRVSAAWRRRWTGARHRAARAVAARVDAGVLPWKLVDAAFSRAGAELRRAMERSRADIIFAGTSGALGSAAAASATARRRYGIDLEDLHTAEREDEGAGLHHRLAGEVLSRVLAGAALVTTSSEGMAQAYRSSFGIDALVVHNVWPLPDTAPELATHDGPLGFYWFSQTIGATRGLEQSIAAIGAADIDARLVLRGSVDQGYRHSLERLAASVAPRLAIDLQAPVPPDRIAESCRGFDVGLSTELPVVENRHHALSNKLFMYLTTGLAVLATPSAAQRGVLAPMGPHVAWMDPAVPESVAPVLRRWASDRAALLAARRASWDAAVQRWHWEHALERGRFLDRFTRAFA